MHVLICLAALVFLMQIISSVAGLPTLLHDVAFEIERECSIEYLSVLLFVGVREIESESVPCMWMAHWLESVRRE